MMTVSQKKTATIKKINYSKEKTRTDCESISSRNMQNKIWKLGKVQMKNNATYGQQQNKVWDPGGKGWKHMIRRS